MVDKLFDTSSSISISHRMDARIRRVLLGRRLLRRNKVHLPHPQLRDTPLLSTEVLHHDRVSVDRLL